MAVSGWVEHRREHRLVEELRIGLWKGGDAFAFGTEWIFMSGAPKAPYEDLLAYVCKELNLPHVRVQTRDADGLDAHGHMYPAASGEWLDPKTALAGSGAELIKSVNWREYEEIAEGEDGVPDDEASATILPAPVTVINQGLVEVVQEHYSPKMYAAIKELFADTRLSEEAVLRSLEGRFPTFRDLMCHAPTAAMPAPHEVMTLRLHWAKAPLFVVKETLSQRMAMTDMGLDVEGSLVPTPYPMQYLHFESPRQDVCWNAGPDGDLEVSLSGVYVHDHPGDQDSGGVWRVIDLGIVGMDSTGTLGFSDLRLAFNNKSSTLGDALVLWRDGGDERPSEQWVEVMERVSVEVAKVLIYVGSTEARRVEMKLRSNLIARLKGKSAGQRLKAQDELRRIYDYILIGPVEAFEDGGVSSTSGAKKAPHHRRGGLRAVACGPGWTERRMRLFPPVIVNKHLLGQDPAGWPRPKNYRVK